MTGPLLAKSVGPGQSSHGASLREHLRAAQDAAKAILDATGNSQLASLGIEPQWLGRFSKVMLLSSALHDVGKANDHFQGQIRHVGSGIIQGIRHEWVSILLLTQEPWRAWLMPCLDFPADWHTLLWAICGHHRRPRPNEVVPGAEGELRVLLDHQDMKAICLWLQETFGLAESLPPLERTQWKLSGVFGTVFLDLARFFAGEDTAWSAFSDGERRLAAAVKACVMAADVAASATCPRGFDPGGWTREALATRNAASEIASVVSRRLEGRSLRPFQQEVAEDGHAVTLVRAGCGSGKTLAAYQWCAANHPGRRLFFCYPTTGTATEGFREYLVDPELDSLLLHSRAAVDLELILNQEDDPAENQARIESLNTWQAGIISCTADTVLGLIQNQRRGLYGWPALAQGSFVFDEVHAYDDRLFGALLRFLEACPGLPILLMTASLPRGRLEAIRECVQASGRGFRMVDGPADREALKRYVHQPTASLRESIDLARMAFSTGQKVMIVCNTVLRAMEAADALRDVLPVLYHSRFRYEDRVRRHAELIDRFKAQGPALVVCTQVAEVSLDISADLLVTDLAPVPSLIQRLGRLNRRSEPHAPAPCRPFLVVQPPGPLPYEAREFAVATRWLTQLGEGQLSQQDLVSAWLAIEQGQHPAHQTSAWLDGGPVTQVLELREVTPGITVLLPQDAPSVRQDSRQAIRLAIPMPPPPRRLDYRDWDLVRSLLVAPEGSINYDSTRGAQWRN